MTHSWLTYGSIMAFHALSPRTKAHNSQYKLCRSLTTPSVSPLNYWHLSIHRKMNRQTSSIRRSGSFYGSIALKSKIHGLPDLPITQFSINTKNHASTKKSPFDVTQLYLPQMGIESINSDMAPVVQKFTLEMEDVIESMNENMKQAQDWIKVNADKCCSAAPKYAISQQTCWLSTENLHLTRASRKLSEWWLGHYTIISLAGPNAIELNLPKLMPIHPVVNILRVKLYHDRLRGATLAPTQDPSMSLKTETTDGRWTGTSIHAIKIKHWNSSFIGRATMTWIIPGTESRPQ